MHARRDCLDQGRWVRVVLERANPDHAAILDDGIESAPMGMVSNESD
jgi:hypothetical protein